MRPISDPLSAINCTGAPPPAMPSTFTRRSTSGRVATPNMRVTRVMWTKTTRRRRSRSWTLSATNVGTTSGTTDAQDGTEKDFPLLKPNFSVVSFKYTHDIYPNYFCFCYFWRVDLPYVSVKQSGPGGIIHYTDYWRARSLLFWKLIYARLFISRHRRCS